MSCAILKSTTIQNSHKYLSFGFFIAVLPYMANVSRPKTRYLYLFEKFSKAITVVIAIVGKINRNIKVPSRLRKIRFSGIHCFVKNMDIFLRVRTFGNLKKTKEGLNTKNTVFTSKDSVRVGRGAHGQICRLKHRRSRENIK